MEWCIIPADMVVIMASYEKYNAAWNEENIPYVTSIILNDSTIGYSPSNFVSNGTTGPKVFMTGTTQCKMEFGDTIGCYDPIHLVEVSTTYTKGTYKGYKSDASSSRYPNNTYMSSYWYEYQGSDCIDPTAVTYSTNTASVGDTVTVSVTSRTNTYGGTISYIYEYSTDFGATWTSATTATATSCNITIPSGASNLIARVKAKDNYGFTSPVYVYGSGITVSAPETYTVTFNSNGGTGSMTPQTFTDGVAQNLTSNGFTRDGYTFSGWATSAGGAKAYDNGASYTAISDVTLYAVWTPITYTITYNLDGGSVTGNPSTYTITSNTITLNNPTKAGHTFKGWTGSNGTTASTSVTIPQGSTGNKTYTANWTKTANIITFTSIESGLAIYYSIVGGDYTYRAGTGTVVEVPINSQIEIYCMTGEGYSEYTIDGSYITASSTYKFTPTSNMQVVVTAAPSYNESVDAFIKITTVN